MALWLISLLHQVFRKSLYFLTSHSFVCSLASTFPRSVRLLFLEQQPQWHHGSDPALPVAAAAAVGGHRGARLEKQDHCILEPMSPVNKESEGIWNVDIFRILESGNP
jgi:hypothetical protein